MFIGAINFFGKLSARGWFVTLLACLVGAVLTYLVGLELTEGRRATVAERDAVVGVMLWMFVLFVLTALGATTRRLRDSGSRWPYLALLVALFVPALGWLWLIYRALSGAPAEAKPGNGVSAKKTAAGKKSTQVGVKAPERKEWRDAPASELHRNGTVVRVRRQLGPRARRRVAF